MAWEKVAVGRSLVERSLSRGRRREVELPAHCTEYGYRAWGIYGRSGKRRRRN
jgi:hypothetical protein